MERMQLADFIQKENTAVGFCDSAFLGLRDTRDAVSACALVNRIMHAADQRIGNIAFVVADARRVHLYKLRIRLKGRDAAFLGAIHHKTRRTRLAHAGRPVYQHVLRVFAAQRGAKRRNAFFLPNDLVKTLRPRFF
jgi:hypothetical protein